MGVPGGVFAFTDSAADTAAGRVSSLATSMSTDIHDIDGHVKDIGGSWKGGEYTTYSEVERRWSLAATNAKDALDKIKTLVDGHKDAVGKLKEGINQALDG